MSLSAYERQRFAAWLEAEAETGRALMEQMEKLGGPMMTVFINRHKAEIAASLLIANKLRSIEDVVVK